MNHMVKIAVDMMGGDHAPNIVLEAVEKAVHDFEDLEILLVSAKSNLAHSKYSFHLIFEGVSAPTL